MRIKPSQLRSYLSLFGSIGDLGVLYLRVEERRVLEVGFVSSAEVQRVLEQPVRFEAQEAALLLIGLGSLGNYLLQTSFPMEREKWMGSTRLLLTRVCDTALMAIKE